MSLSCSCADYGEYDWYWELAENFDFEPLATKRSRKCCSCRKRIMVGDDCVKVFRHRSPSDRCNWLEESIYGDQVPLANWYLCEICGGLMMAIIDLGLCCTLGDASLKDQIEEFNEAMGIQTLINKI